GPERYRLRPCTRDLASSPRVGRTTHDARRVLLRLGRLVQFGQERRQAGVAKRDHAVVEAVRRRAKDGGWPARIRLIQVDYLDPLAGAQLPQLATR
ncbi:MAG TPA: hypothetical protein VGJ87_00115, partial [Roseiflexaceae bacterium]